MTNKAKLYLIPNVIAQNDNFDVISRQVLEVLPGITHFLAENIRTARRFLSGLKLYDSIEGLAFSVLDKETKETELPFLLTPLQNGFNMGIVSESGCPGIADPGAAAVRFAHDKGYPVIPLVGPSSVLLALMASGLNGQRFAFNGYLPQDKIEAQTAIRHFEKESRRLNQTQIFIETPYRNNALLQTFLKTLHAQSLLTIAFDITGPTEFIQTKRVDAWRNTVPELAKTPCVFLFLG